MSVKIDRTSPQRESLGLSPAVLAKRKTYKPERWGPNIHPLMMYYDPWCDPFQPKIISYKEITRAHNVLKNKIEPTPLTKAHCPDFNMNLYFKRETVHKTGSFYERAAIYALTRLTKTQRENGIFTASCGAWAVSLLHHAQKMDIPVKAYVPVTCRPNFLRQFSEYGDSVVKAGANLHESKKLAIKKMTETGLTDCYINGFDHPDAIAASGTIGVEILEQCPTVHAILIPIDGGGLCAGIAKAVKSVKPDTLVYGMESYQENFLFRSMEAGKPFHMKDDKNATEIGYNAFNTLQPLIDKVVLVDDDCIARALLYYVEDEKFMVDYRSSTALAALFHDPNILPELRGKNVVCVINSGFMDYFQFKKSLTRGTVAAGRLITLKVHLPTGSTRLLARVFSSIKRLKCSLLDHDFERNWIEPSAVGKYNVTLEIETRDHKHTAIVKNVMNRLFPNMIEFSNYASAEKTFCICYPKIWPKF